MYTAYMCTAYAETKQHSNSVQGIQNYASKYVQTLSRKYTVSTYGHIISWNYPSKFTDFVSLKVCMYTHAELRSNVPTYKKPEPHQTMLIQLV